MLKHSFKHGRVLIAWAVCLITHHAVAQGHGDLAFSIAEGRVVTNAQKAVASFREVVVDSQTTLWVTSNPGFNAARGAFSPNASVTFFVDHPLMAWDGGRWSQDAAQDEQVRFFKDLESDGSVGGDQIVITADMDLPSDGLGFEIAKADADGRFHDHWWFDLSSHSAGVPTEGVYAFSLRFDSPGRLPSEPVWFAFNHNAISQDLIQAVASIPEPAVIGPLALLGLLLRHRKRPA